MARESASKRGIFGFVSAIVVVALILLLIGTRNRSGNIVARMWRGITDWVTVWVPAHPEATSVIVIYVIMVLIINTIAGHLGRLGMYIFAAVIEVSVWLVFWYGASFMKIGSFWHQLEPNRPKLPTNTVWTILVFVLIVTGIIYWLREIEEEVEKQNPQQHYPDRRY